MSMNRRQGRPWFRASARSTCTLLFIAVVGAADASPAPTRLSGRMSMSFEEGDADGRHRVHGGLRPLEVQADRVQLDRNRSDSARLAWRLEGADAAAPGVLEGRRLGVVNYLLGDRPEAWRTGVERSERLLFDVACDGGR